MIADRCPTCGFTNAAFGCDDSFHIIVATVTAVNTEAVVHPAHYGGGDNPYEAIKVIEAWDLDFHTGNTVKYISRAGKKDPTKELEDLRKARWYLDRKISNLENV